MFRLGRLSAAIQIATSTSFWGYRCSAMSTAKIAVAQVCSTSSKLDNLVNVAKCAGLARKEGCVMLFLPECFGFMGESAEQTLEEADPSMRESTAANDSPVTNILKLSVNGLSAEHDQKSLHQISILDSLRTIAKESDMWISAGGMHVAGAPPGDESNQRVYNTHVILDNGGIVKAVYRKVHLFDVSIPGKVDLRESKTTAPGGEIVVCDSPIGKS
jgi:deaminated glutathione amidase